MDVQLYVVRVVFVLRADLTLIDTFVHRSDVLYDQTPLVRPLIVIDPDASVRCEGIKADGQRMDFVQSLPRHLER